VAAFRSLDARLRIPVTMNGQSVPSWTPKPVIMNTRSPSS